MISNKHKTIFVHIPKVAGQSIEVMYLNDLGLTWNQRGVLLLRKKKLFEKGPKRLAHLTAKQYVDLNYIDQKSFNEYFKFSFVRNPFSRTYSYYKYLGYSNVCSFEYFIEFILTKGFKQNHFFFLTQTAYLYDSNGKLLVDFVGKFENLKEDIQKVAKNSGLKNQTLPFVNKSKGEMKRGLGKLKSPKIWFNLSTSNTIFKDYRKAYNEKTIKIVNNLYQEDLNNFGYDFEN